MSAEARERRLLTSGASKTAAFACALVLASPTARAAAASEPNGLSALRRSSAYQQAVIAGAQRSGAWIVNPCAGAKGTLGDRLGISVPPGFDDKGQPTAGAWIEHVTLDGCGGQRLLNVLVLVRSPGQLATVPLLPGTTRADPRLQKDGAAYAFIAAKIDNDGCKPIYVVDTTFLGFSAETPAVPGEPAWSERWTVVQCERRVPVVLRFIPDKRGTAIVIDHLAGSGP